MATVGEAGQAILDEIEAVARNERIPSAPKALMLLRLAEAYAWLSRPDQSHGASASLAPEPQTR